MRILITGGAGFIGSHLARFLLRQACDVVCMDNFVTGSPENITPLGAHPRFHFIQQDVTSYIALDGPLDWVLHLASPASPRDYLELPIQTLKVGALGTHNALGLAKAKQASFLLTSTSEVYGDPLVHPQREEYWGNVNPVGPRGVYDEAKRFAEAMTMAYHRTHGVPTRIVRIFNSIAADEDVVVVKDESLYFGTIGAFAEQLSDEMVLGHKLQVPAFDPSTGHIALRDVSAVIKHPTQSEMFEIRTRYGRTVRVTGDHSVFRRERSGLPEATPVRELRVGDDIAIPAVLPTIERDLRHINISRHLIDHAPADELWEYAVCSASFGAIIREHREEIHRILLASGRIRARLLRNGLICASNRFLRQSFLPLAIVKALDIEVPDDATIRIFKGGAHVYLPDRIGVGDDVLWLLGFFMAEGCAHERRNKSAWLAWSSDQRFLDRAADILKRRFNIEVVRVAHSPQRAPSIIAHSKVLLRVFKTIFDVAGESIPRWVFQLPLQRLKWFVEGYREGDGTHSGKKVGHELCFDTKSKRRAADLTMLLLRFGIVASVGHYRTTCRKKYGDRRFPFSRVTICSLSTFDVLDWDKGVVQKLNAKRWGDLVWAKIRSLRQCPVTDFVYDFSVPFAENFVAGNGVSCHNTHGPQMRLDDGRAIPAFMTQALRGEPVTVFGDGSQTRSFMYIDDLVDGLWRAMNSDVSDPINMGNPHEMTLLELAKRIIRLAGSASDIVFHPLPVDDPKVRQPDITRARTLLGWEPRVDTDEGLRLTLDWFRDRLGASA
jgi:nucleoside-diphosphate-sugar epimerase/intein/homing endonuclease